MNYIFANPSGNITVLVTTDVPETERLSVVQEMFKAVPTCEQVGFVSVLGPKRIRLEMMGGEFCGNATMSAAAYLASMNDSEGTFTVESSGVDEPVEVEIKRKSDSCGDLANGKNCEQVYIGTLEMPMPELGRIECKTAGGETVQCPLINLDGISHMLMPENLYTREEMESSIKRIADEIGVPALGMIKSLGGNSGGDVAIEPLVYVKESNTLVWENGCASGSIATAFYRFKKDGCAETAVRNPGGVLTVRFEGGKVFITGEVSLSLLDKNPKMTDPN